MTAATFHNTMLTVVSGYAEALAELEAARVEALRMLDLVKRARPVSPRLLDATRALIATVDAPGNLQYDKELDELRAALAEMSP